MGTREGDSRGRVTRGVLNPGRVGLELSSGLYRRFGRDELAGDLWAAGFGDVLGLFQEAASAYDFGMYRAATLMARSAVECAGYVLLTNRATEYGFDRRIPIKLNGEVRAIEYGEILDGLKASLALSGDDLAALVALREAGNFVAHLSSRRDLEREKAERAWERWVHSGQKGSQPLPKYWILPEEALRHLQAGRTLIERVAHQMFGELKAASQSHGVGPA